MKLLMNHCHEMRVKYGQDKQTGRQTDPQTLSRTSDTDLNNERRNRDGPI